MPMSLILPKKLACVQKHSIANCGRNLCKPSHATVFICNILSAEFNIKLATLQK